MSDKIKPSEVSEVLLQQLQEVNGAQQFDEVGTVLTVGDGVEPGGLLFFDEPGDLLIFHLLQVQGGNLAPGKTVPGLFDPVRTQETSYNIKTKWCLQSHS